MGVEVSCPSCQHTFYIHGSGTMPGQEVVKCYECNTLFNPRHQLEAA